MKDRSQHGMTISKSVDDMTLGEALTRNPYDPQKGNASAYCRYLRYNVDGWYGLTNEEAQMKWHAHEADKTLENPR